WRRARKVIRYPDKDDLAKALSLGGYEKLLLDARNRTAELTRPGMLLDLGGIAKGYAADEATAVLRRHGFGRALVAAGGDIVAADAPPGEEGWKVGIAPLEDPESEPQRYLLLKHGGVSTS